MVQSSRADNSRWGNRAAMPPRHELTHPLPPAYVDKVSVMSIPPRRVRTPARSTPSSPRIARATRPASGPSICAARPRAPASNSPRTIPRLRARAFAARTCSPTSRRCRRIFRSIWNGNSAGCGSRGRFRLMRSGFPEEGKPALSTNEGGAISLSSPLGGGMQDEVEI